MSENKTRKYIKYALGEILLVMLGILLALQVNNWNTSRLDNLEAGEYLSRLGEDLKNDTIYLAKEIKNSESERESLSLFLSSIYEKQNSHHDFINLLKLADWNPRNVHIQDNTYEEMKSSGKIDLIESNTLRSALIDYYKVKDYTYEHLEVTTQHGFTLLMTIFPELKKYYDYEMLKQHDIFGVEDWGWINDPSDLKFKTLSATIGHFSYKSILASGYYNLLNEKAVELLSLIEQAKSN